MGLDDENEIKSGLLAARKRRSSQSTADFETSFKSTGTTRKEAVADPNGEGTRNGPKNRDLGLVRKGRQSVKLRDFMQRMQKDNADLHAACAAKTSGFCK